MKKYILMVLVALSTLLSAQATDDQAEAAGDITVAAQFAYATKHSMAGLGLQAQF